MAAAEYFGPGAPPSLDPPQPQRASSNPNVKYRPPPDQYSHSPPFLSPEPQPTTPQLQPPPPYGMSQSFGDEQKPSIHFATPPLELSDRHVFSDQTPNPQQWNNAPLAPSGYKPRIYTCQQPPHAAPRLRPYMMPQTLDESSTGGYSSDPEHYRKRHRHEKRDRRTTGSSGSAAADGFIGAAGGGLIRDLIFPGLGTVGGALVGWLGGKDYGLHRKQRVEKMHQAKKKWERKHESRDHSRERWRRSRSSSLETEEKVPFVSASHPSHDMQWESTPGSSHVVADELLQTIHPVVSATKSAANKASTQQDSITPRSSQSCPSPSISQSVAADHAHLQVAEAVTEASLQFQSVGDPTISSPTRSAGFNSDSPSEISFIGVKETAGLETLSLRELRPATVVFIEQLSTRILRTCINSSDASFSRLRGSSGGSSKSGSSNSSSQVSAEQCTPAKHTSLPIQRLSQQEDGDDEADEHSRRQNASARPQSENAGMVRLFACPYSKFNPHRYSKQNLQETRYRNCASSYLRDISRLKQHLYRVHALPKHYCIRCYQSFKTRERYNVHARTSPPCHLRSESLYQERMTEDQYDRIHRRVVKGDSYKLWYNIYEVLFPGKPRPSSPYVSTADPCSVAHFAELFRALGPEVMLDFMRDRREQAGGALEIEIPTQMVIDEAFELAAPQFVERVGLTNAQDTGMAQASSSVTAANDTLDTATRASPATDEMQHGFRERHQSDTSAAAPNTRAIPERHEGYAESLEPPRHISSQSMLLPAQYTTDPTFTPDWPYGYEFDPSEVTSGFDNYALLGNAQLDAIGTASPTILESFPEGGSGYRQHFGYEPLQWPNHA